MVSTLDKPVTLNTSTDETPIQATPERHVITLDHNTDNYIKVVEYPLMPREFQITGIDFMRKHKRVLNRDQMGLGKTLEGVYASVGPTLIVCPNYLTEQWYHWLRGIKKGPEAHPPYAPYGRQKVVWCKGTAEQKLAKLNRKADFHIINMEALSYLQEEIEVLAESGKWTTLILDEAHHFRNKDADRAKTACNIGLECEYVYLLTGTPIWKEVDDLYMQFRILQPKVFKSYYQFIDQFCIADETRYGTRVLGVKKSQIKELDRLLAILSIGRGYADARRELPPVINKVIKVEFPPEILKAYRQMCETFRMDLLDNEIKFDNFSQILRTMRLMTAFPGKHEAAKEILEDIHDTKHKAVIFTWYRETADAAAKMLGGVSIHGGITDVKERRRLALSSPIICATISALGEGIDLSDARTVIFLEEHYTPGSIDQAMARVVRERQNANNTDPVLCYYIHVKDTIDEVIHEKTQSRGGTIKEILKESLGL